MVAKMANKKGWKGKLGGKWYANLYLTPLEISFIGIETDLNILKRSVSKSWHILSFGKKQEEVR